MFAGMSSLRALEAIERVKEDVTVVDINKQRLEGLELSNLPYWFSGTPACVDEREGEGRGVA